MKVIQPGHVYELSNSDGDGKQTLEFVRRRDNDAILLPEQDRREGVQSQEVLRVLIDRTIHLGAEQAWHENIEILNHLRAALKLYEARAAHSSINKLGMSERAQPCIHCGHILCFCEEPK